MSFRDPFGLRPDTAFADDRAREETQKCVSESKTCAGLVETLAKDKNTWTIATGSVPGASLGEPSYRFNAVGQLAGGTLTVEGDAQKYAAATVMMGAEATYRSTLVHEAAHVAGNLELERTGPLTEARHCGEPCALGPTNVYRVEVGLTPLRFR